MRSFLLRSSLYKHCSMDLVKSNCCSVSFSVFTDGICGKLQEPVIELLG